VVIIKLAIFILFSFLGYVAGRIGDKYGGHMDVPHHWIYGLIMIIVGLVYFDNFYWWAIFVAGGFGVFISDLNDFLRLRFYGPDESESPSFWGID
jgi:hypothetical protein